MSDFATDTRTNDRFEKFEYSGDDFPYYDGKPIAISGLQWLFLLAAVAVGFLCLIVPVPLFATAFGQFIPAILFFAIPIAALAIVAGGHYKAIFRKVRGRDIVWMVLFALLNIVVTMLIGALVIKTHGATTNETIAGAANMSAAEFGVLLLKTIPQLFGEEVLTILPFLALMYFFYGKLKLSRRNAILLAWLVSALWFGSVHLPTYGWNFVQCLVVIGTARLLLLLPYLKTKNIWVSTGAHILNDWIFLGMTWFGGQLGAGATA